MICAKKLMMIMRIIFVILIMSSMIEAARHSARERLPLKEDDQVQLHTANARHENKRRKASGKA